MRQVLAAFEAVFHALMLALIMGALIPLWRDVSGQPINPYQGDSLTRGLLVIGYGLVLLMLLRFPKRFIVSVFRSPVLWLLLIWASLSVVWSTTPEVTLRKVVAVSLTSFYGVYLALRYSSREFLRLLGFTFFMLLGVSLLVVFLFPEWGLMGYPHEGAWRGVFVHKNVLGRFAAFGILIFLALLIDHKSARLLWLVGLFLSGGLLLESYSVTSWVLGGTTLLLAIGLKVTTPFRRCWPLLLFLALFVVGGLLMLLASSYELLLELLGKDVTLTGRIPLWQTLIPFIQERPWNGYGLGGFWLGWEGPSALVWNQVGWDPPHGHNGYLDLWLDLGFVGLFLGLWLLLSLLFRSVLQYLKDGFSATTLFMLGLSVFLAVFNLAESNFLRPNNFYWLLMVWAYVSLGLMSSKKGVSFDSRNRMASFSE